ncbi:MAG: hypothetical protein WCX12_02235 [Candidatus Paceibacterota bacterium]|jgi:hypothetical protein
MARRQDLLSGNGVSIDLAGTAKEANRNVDRDEGVPVHACGLVSHRDCPCWICTKNGCAACLASLL